MRGPSHRQYDVGDTSTRLGISHPEIRNQLPLGIDRRAMAESLDDDAIVRAALASAIRACAKSREQIADEMTVLLGIRVTEKMLNSYTGESNRQYRWPAAWDRAFCRATGDDTLLVCRIQLAGLFVITPAERELLDFGRECLRQKRSAENLALLEKRLHGVEL